MRTAKAMMHDMFIIRLYKQIEKQVRLFFYLLNIVINRLHLKMESQKAVEMVLVVPVVLEE
jgi:hypothetical protein